MKRAAAVHHDAPGHTEEANEDLQKEIAERKRTEALVKKEHQRFNDILEQLPVMICLLTPDYHIPFANRRFRELFGEAQGRRCFEYIFHRTEPCPECQSFTPLKTHAPHHWERTLPNGTCLDIYDFPFTDVDGSPLILEMDIDITERKRVEEALRQERDFAEGMIETAQTIVLVLDTQGRIVRFNPYMEELSGYGLGEVQGKDWFTSFVPEHDRERIQRLFLNAIGDISTHGNVNAIVTKDGRRREIEWHDKTLKDLQGNIIGLLATGQDITERRRGDVALRLSETKFRTLYDSTSNAIILVDENGGFFDCNPATLTIFGCATREEFLSKHPADLSPPIQPDGTDSRMLANRQLATALEKGSHQFEWMHKRADTGEGFPADVLLSVMELDGKRVLLATVRDLTERKQAEMRMQMFSHEIVTARENERRHLSSVLHHDVGSLAVGISAYLDAIEEDLRSEKPGKALRWMPRTRKLFDQSLKRLKGLAVELRPPELDVLGLGAALRQHFSLVTKRGGIRIRFKERQHGNRLIGDTAIVLFRVAQEALTNAIQHGLAKRVAVDLLTFQKGVRLTIRDNGKGFDPSEQMKLSMSHLGLRVMREMADFIGGAFTIDSSPGKGTTVRLTLPIETVPASAPLPPSPRLWRTGRRGKTIRSDVRSARPRKGSRA